MTQQDVRSGTRKLAVKEQRPSFELDGGARGKAGAPTLRGAASGWELWRESLLVMPALGETADQPPRLAVNVVLKVGQCLFAVLARGLPHE